MFRADLPGVETHVYLGQLIRTGRDASGPLRETIVHRRVTGKSEEYMDPRRY